MSASFSNSVPADDISRFSIVQAKGLVKDLSKPVAVFYWIDFIATIVLGHAAFGILLHIEQLTGWSGEVLWASRLLLFGVVSILYMRAAMFIHELIHLPRGEFRGFRIAWNLLCGIPFLIPSFVYYPHIDHHRRKHYGTERDGEYLALSHWHPANILVFLAAALIVPLATFLRFAVMSPNYGGQWERDTMPCIIYSPAYRITI
ncbi:MAG: fatty acid desaturase [Planctomycetales bacterium]|nr:fatty acid desaturase [Planctomycetales bacterium]